MYTYTQGPTSVSAVCMLVVVPRMAGVVTIFLVIISLFCCLREMVCEENLTTSPGDVNATHCTQCWPVPMVDCHNQIPYINTRYIVTATNNSYPLTFSQTNIGLYRRKGLEKKTILYRKLPQNISDLENFFCGDIHREGYLCGNCKENCGIAIYSYYGLPCACPCKPYGIPLYLLLELGFSTLFFAVVFTLKCSAHSSKWMGCIFYFQFTANFITPSPLIFTTLTITAKSIPLVLLTLHGIWNMDFLRLILPQFCVTPRATILGAIATGYIAALWPLVLIILTSLAMELHKRNYKVTVYAWKLINRISSGKMRRHFAYTNLVHTFATFLLLSYLKTMVTSCSLLAIVHSYELKNATDFSRHTLLSLDPNIPYHSKEHMLYALPALIIILLLGVLLPIVLILYHTRLGSRLCCASGRTGRYRQAITTFIEAFQGSYKDGTKGNRDYRAVSGVYLLMRVITTFVYVFNETKSTAPFNSWLLIAAALCMGIAAFFGLAKPYKIARHNLIDVMIYCLMAVQCMYLYFIYSLWYYERRMIHTVTWLSFLPVTVAMGTVLKPYVRYAVQQFKQTVINS